MIFTHIKDWGYSSHGTYCPIDKNGKVIPHIFGHICDDKDVWGTHFIQDFEKYDLYKITEDIHSRFGLLGQQTYAIPTGFEKCEPFVTMASYIDTYCDSGCSGCGYEYPHQEWGATPISGVFLVQKGVNVFDIIEQKRGSSFFPLIFTLQEIK